MKISPTIGPVVRLGCCAVLVKVVVDGDRVVGVRAVRGLVVCVFIYHYSLWDFASSTHVSALTSQMTDSRRFADESVSTLTNGGILADK